jgi:hypothetical protein
LHQQDRRERLRRHLDQCSGERSRRGSTGLRRHDCPDRAADPSGGEADLAVVIPIGKWRDHAAAPRRTEWSLSPFLLTAHDQIHQFDDVVDMGGVIQRQTYMLGSARDSGVGRVEIGGAKVRDIGGNHHLGISRAKSYTSTSVEER